VGTRDRSLHRYVSSKGRNYITNNSPAYTLLSRDLVEARVRNGVALPNWKNIIRAGNNATTPLTATWQEASSPRFSDWAEAYYKPNPPLRYLADCSGDIFFRNNQSDSQFYVLNDTSEKLFVDNLAYADFYSTLRQVQTQFHGATFVGELGEALHMLRHPFQGLQDRAKEYLATLRKRKRADPTRWIKEASNVWLEQSFGWKPLLNDIQDAAKAWRRLTVPDQGQTYNSYTKKDFDGKNHLTSFTLPGVKLRYVNGGIYLTVAAHLRRTYIVKYKFHVRARVEAPQWVDTQLFGFTPEEWIPTAWELLPWSFLADYFTNIGDILNASVTSTRDVSWINRSYTFRTEYHRTMRHMPEDSVFQSNGLWQFVGGSRNQYAMYTKHKALTRSAVAGVPMPTLQFNFSLTNGQLGNIAALLGQANALYPQSKPTPWNRYINKGPRR
jgi:hypothetical protein